MTIAEKISALLNDDGQVWYASDGRHFADLLEDYPGTKMEWRDGYRTGDTVRYTFSDGSVILEAGAAWDFGFQDCFCWQGEPDEDCPNHGKGGTNEMAYL